MCSTAFRATDFIDLRVGIRATETPIAVNFAGPRVTLGQGKVYRTACAALRFRTIGRHTLVFPVTVDGKDAPRQ